MLQPEAMSKDQNKPEPEDQNKPEPEDQNKPEPENQNKPEPEYWKEPEHEDVRTLRLFIKKSERRKNEELLEYLEKNVLPLEDRIRENPELQINYKDISEDEEYNEENDEYNLPHPASYAGSMIFEKTLDDLIIKDIETKARQMKYLEATDYLLDQIEFYETFYDKERTGGEIDPEIETSRPLHYCCDEYAEMIKAILNKLTAENEATEAPPQQRPGSGIKFNLKQIEAVELILALIENGKVVGIKRDIYREFSAFFDIDISENIVTANKTHIANRKPMKLHFIDRLQKSLLQQLLQESEKPKK